MFEQIAPSGILCITISHGTSVREISSVQSYVNLKIKKEFCLLLVVLRMYTNLYRQVIFLEEAFLAIRTCKSSLLIMNRLKQIFILKIVSNQISWTCTLVCICKSFLKLNDIPQILHFHFLKLLCPTMCWLSLFFELKLNGNHEFNFNSKIKLWLTVYCKHDTEAFLLDPALHELLYV